MSDYLPVPLGRRGGVDPTSAAARLLRAFLNGRKAETITAYRQDLEDFQAFIQAPSLEQAASLLLARGPGEANALAPDYKAHLMDRELAANTINRRLTALRSFFSNAVAKPFWLHQFLNSDISRLLCASYFA
jgi:site-specific recombinase XerD